MNIILHRANITLLESIFIFITGCIIFEIFIFQVNILYVFNLKPNETLTLNPNISKIMHLRINIKIDSKRTDFTLFKTNPNFIK